MNKTTKRQIQWPPVRSEKEMAELDAKLMAAIAAVQLRDEKAKIKTTLLHVAADYYEVSVEELKKLIIQDWLDKCIKFPVVPGAGKTLMQFKPVCADLEEEN